MGPSKTPTGAVSASNERSTGVAPLWPQRQQRPVLGPSDEVASSSTDHWCRIKLQYVVYEFQQSQCAE